MSWIKTIPYEEAKGKLKQLYKRVKGPDNNVDNIMMVHSLRPHSMEGHMHIYKYVLHHNGNTFPKWYLETIGVYVSMLNDCSYCVEHHYQGMRRLVNDEERSVAVRKALEARKPEASFDGKELALLKYAEKLTLAPATIKASDLDILREAGADDGEILEVNQVTSYFCYANRTVLGLGVNTEGDIIGLSPNENDEPDNWNHA
ncbi:MAG: peroxidase-related enzyme [Roseivirga sp.]|nr:peroxidase-related enzyme [Roseivirga sp.]